MKMVREAEKQAMRSLVGQRIADVVLEEQDGPPFFRRLSLVLESGAAVEIYQEGGNAGISGLHARPAPLPLLRRWCRQG